MRRKILIFTMLLATAFLSLPVDSFASGAPAQNKWERRQRSERGRYWNDDDQGRRRRSWRNRNRTYYGYRNYGQYRRTQVGNRRFRMVRRYYYNGGTRLTRWTRVYY